MPPRSGMVRIARPRHGMAVAGSRALAGVQAAARTRMLATDQVARRCRTMEILPIAIHLDRRLASRRWEDAERLARPRRCARRRTAAFRRVASGRGERGGVQSRGRCRYRGDAVGYIIEATQEAVVDPGAIFALYMDPSTWSIWGHNVRWARADGPLVEGGTVEVRPKYPVTYHCRIVRLVPNALLRIEVKPVGLRIVNVYEVAPSMAARGSGMRSRSPGRCRDHSDGSESPAPTSPRSKTRSATASRWRRRRMTCRPDRVPDRCSACRPRARVRAVGRRR